MIVVLTLLSASLCILAWAIYSAPQGHESRDGLVIDVADHQADQGAKFADELSKGLR